MKIIYALIIIFTYAKAEINIYSDDWAAQAFKEGLGNFYRTVTHQETEADKWKKKYHYLMMKYNRIYTLKDREKMKYYTKWRKTQQDIYRLKKEIKQLRKAMKDCQCNITKTKKHLDIKITDPKDINITTY